MKLIVKFGLLAVVCTQLNLFAKNGSQMDGTMMSHDQNTSMYDYGHQDMNKDNMYKKKKYRKNGYYNKRGNKKYDSSKYDTTNYNKDMNYDSSYKTNTGYGSVGDTSTMAAYE